MNLGSGSLGYQNAPQSPGAPFLAGSADNGNSVDVTTGKIVLGEDLGSGSALATLLSNREIPMDQFIVQFTKAFFQLIIGATSDGGGGFTVATDQASEGTPLGIEFNDLAVMSDYGKVFQNAINPGSAQTFGTALTQYNSINGNFFGVLARRNSVFVGPVGAVMPVASGAVLEIAGDLSTDDPGSGSGLWKLGKFVAGAVALDNANYVEVEIDGVVRKLLVAV